MKGPPKLVEIRVSGKYRLRLRYDDGIDGEVDLSELAGTGVFKAWNTPGVFERARVGPNGEVRWDDEIDLCTDALYLKLTGKRADEVFESLRDVSAHA